MIVTIIFQKSWDKNEKISDQRSKVYSFLVSKQEKKLISCAASLPNTLNPKIGEVIIVFQ